ADGWSGCDKPMGGGPTDQPSTDAMVGRADTNLWGMDGPTNHRGPPSLVGPATMSLWGTARPTNHRRSLSLVRPPPIYRGWTDRQTINGLRGRLKECSFPRSALVGPGRPAG